MAIGITIFWKAHRYSASPIPLVGHGMLTELSPVSEPQAEEVGKMD